MSKRSGVNQVEVDGGVLLDPRFWKQVFGPNGQPVDIRVDLTELVVFRRTGMGRIGVGGLEDTDVVPPLVGNHIVFPEGPQGHFLVFGHLADFIIGKAHQSGLGYAALGYSEERTGFAASGIDRGNAGNSLEILGRHHGRGPPPADHKRHAVVLKEFALNQLGILVTLLIQVLGNIPQVLGQVFGRVGDGPVNSHMIVGQAVSVTHMAGRITLDEQGVIHRQKHVHEVIEVDRVQIFMGPVKLFRQRQGLGFQQVGLRGPVDIEETDILFMNRRDDILDKNHQKGFLALVFDSGNSRAGFELPFFNERIGKLTFGKLLIGLDQGIIQHELVQFVPEQFVIGSAQAIELAQFFSDAPKGHRNSPRLEDYLEVG
ncbi:hypothetical protein DESC_370236 [Desulfosarcina cetonica]|nr:hypothetical protein DESC_370236 [Desulfosarcina cetonica]